ncbi:MAG: methyltransferase domain-containing protein [Dehalococcoidales bacterium]|nr:methyltransferase domain-containing protein [Dehalococcoidales bacterium]
MEWYQYLSLGLTALPTIYLKVTRIFYELWKIGLFLGLVAWQGVVLLRQSLDKNKKYEAASAFAAAIGKPLLVAGGPLGVTWLRRFSKVMAHGYGDVCFDINPRAFDGCPCGVIADVRHIPFADKSFGAVFASHLLEHLPSVADAQKALAELNRVAEAVFIAYPHRWSIIAWLIPSHHLWIWQKDGETYFKQRRI